METPTTLPLTSIYARPQIRQRSGFDQASLSGLAETIKAVGVLQPILVCQSGKDAPAPYELIAGERRLLAASLAGLEHIPVKVQTCSGRETRAMQAIENLQREDLALADVAEGLAALQADYPVAKDLAQLLGKSPSWLSKHLSLNRLTEAGLYALQSGLTADLETILNIDKVARLKTPQAQRVLGRCLKALEAGTLTRMDSADAVIQAKLEADAGESVNAADDIADTDEDGAGTPKGATATREKFGRLELAESAAKLLLLGLTELKSHDIGVKTDRDRTALVAHLEAFMQKTWG